ncbi:MAG TPA: hypothetical protein VN038_24005, partial [Dyadobacter sp.]|nr:hypothetical protein [Dyadobacter sp.]
MKKYNKAILALLLLGITGSCKDNLLDVNPLESRSTTTFWKTEADAEYALAGLYNFLYAPGGGYSNSQFQIYAWDNFSDNTYSPDNYGGGRTALSSGIT